VLQPNHYFCTAISQVIILLVWSILFRLCLRSNTTFGWGKGGNVTAARRQVTLCDPIWHVISHSGRGATTSSKLGVQFLGLGYYYPSTEQNRQIYSVWCSRLHNHTLFIKKLRKKLGGPSKYFLVVAPMHSGEVICMNCCIYLHFT